MDARARDAVEAVKCGLIVKVSELGLYKVERPEARPRSSRSMAETGYVDLRPRGDYLKAKRYTFMSDGTAANVK